MVNYKKANKKIFLILSSIIAFFAVTFILILIISAAGAKNMELSSEERVTLSLVRMSEAKSGLKGHGFILKDFIDDLEKIIKRYNKKPEEASLITNGKVNGISITSNYFSLCVNIVIWRQ